MEAVDLRLLSLTFWRVKPKQELKDGQQSSEFLVKVGLDRSDGIVAWGGGVGDLAGLLLHPMRGVHFQQIPTSLTAQVDSIGGKTGVNTPWAKNVGRHLTQPDGV